MASYSSKFFLVTLLIFAILLTPTLPCDAARLGHRERTKVAEFDIMFSLAPAFMQNCCSEVPYVLLVYVVHPHHRTDAARVVLVLLVLHPKVVHHDCEGIFMA
ncbi:hypothetical protein RJ640_027557 [Escallonia rubra]|uniref:Uncharacterized protein n=1 Tax=Escallonia rubra TaxID=112253 RepID=A0AA88UAZ9_9ASTE|nr:hypothetical protein RJ640_027557 [Escallonia rubra]